MLRLQDEVAMRSCNVELQGELKFLAKIGTAASKIVTPDFRACNHSFHWIVLVILNRSFVAIKRSVGLFDLRIELSCIVCKRVMALSPASKRHRPRLRNEWESSCSLASKLYRLAWT
jgi:hypothetical protein